MKEILIACRKRLGPAPRVMSDDQSEAFRLRIRARFQNWLRERNDLKLRNLYEQDILRDRGEVGWGHVVQANNVLYNPGNAQTSVAHIIFSLDPEFDDRPGDLQEIANRLSMMTGTIPADPALAEAVHVITDENDVVLCRELPRDFCGGRTVYFTVCLVEPKKLPGRYLAQQLFPVVARPEETPAVMVLPSTFWPDQLVDEWDPRAEPATPRRPKVVPLPPGEICPKGVPNDLPPPHKPGFWQRLTGSTAKDSDAKRQWARRVALNPENDDLLLAFADWLDASNDPQGRFIRTSIDGLDFFLPDDPRLPEINRVWADLFKRHFKRWLKPISDIGIDPYAASFGVPQLWLNQGLIAKVRIDQPGILPEKVNQLFEAIPALQTLEIGSGAFDSSSKRGDSELVRLLWLPPIRQISELDLGSIGMSEADVMVLGEIPYLEGLRSLRVGSTEYAREGAIQLARSRVLTRMRKLNLALWDIGEEGMRSLAASQLFARLVDLDLLGNYIGPGGAEALFASTSLGPLESLNLHANYIGDDGAAALVRCAALQKLRKLQLGQCELTAKGIGLLSASPLFGRLNHLALDSNNLGSDSLQLMASSPNLGRLESLNLACNAIDAGGIQALAASPIVRNLTELSLNYNLIGDDGARALTNSAALAKITSLGLDHNQIGAAGIEAIANSPHLAGLTGLDLRENPFGSDGIRALVRSPYLRHLTRLCVTADDIGEKALAKLRERFGDAVWT